MNKKTRTLLLSMLTLCLCTTLAVGGTFALFTDNVEVNNHIVAGNLEVGLFRTSYTATYLDTAGVVQNGAADTSRVNLATDNSVLFDITDAVPTSVYTATLEVSNPGSTAFDYGVKIVRTNANEADAEDDALASQIEITIESDKLSSPKVFFLSACDAEENRVPLGSMDRGVLPESDDAELFTVTARIIDDDRVNNAAMSGDVRFDVQVFAAQKTEA